MVATVLHTLGVVALVLLVLGVHVTGVPMLPTGLALVTGALLKDRVAK